MKVTVLYFAAVRDLAKTDEEALDLPDNVTTIAKLSDFLAKHHPSLEGRLGHVRFARNEEFSTNDEAITEGDVIALIPPVAGG